MLYKVIITRYETAYEMNVTAEDEEQAVVFVLEFLMDHINWPAKMTKSEKLSRLSVCSVTEIHRF